MKFVPKVMGKARDVNTGQHDRRPIRETLFLFALLVLFVYGAFLATAEVLAAFFPTKWEAGLKPAFDDMCDNADEELTMQAVAILSRIQEKVPLRALDYEVCVTKEMKDNAMVSLGGTIAVGADLLPMVATEEGLAFVIGHELGHVQHRDHLRGISRGLLSLLAIQLLLGDTVLDNTAYVMSEMDSLRFSRKQELAADRFGLSCLVAAYGHAGGATKFFEEMKEAEIPHYFSTHPSGEDRIEQLQAIIREESHPVGEVTPLALPQEAEKDS